MPLGACLFICAICNLWIRSAFNLQQPDLERPCDYRGLSYAEFVEIAHGHPMLHAPVQAGDNCSEISVAVSFHCDSSKAWLSAHVDKPAISVFLAKWRLEMEREGLAVVERPVRLRDTDGPAWWNPPLHGNSGISGAYAELVTPGKHRNFVPNQEWLYDQKSATLWWRAGADD
jgi:hypothetical protein